jgi:hypothetical protein
VFHSSSSSMLNKVRHDRFDEAAVMSITNTKEPMNLEHRLKM